MAKRKGKKETYITLILDKSGSMGRCYAAALSSINEQIVTIKQNAKKGGDTYVSVILFDDTIEVLFENVPAKEVNLLTEDDYVLGGMTALRDAMMTAIDVMVERRAGSKNQGFLAVLISDGMENSSGTTSDELRGRIEELEASDLWTFSYMLDAISWEQAQQFACATGVGVGNISTYTSTPMGTANASNTIQNAVVGYMELRSSNITSSETFYNSGDGTESKVDA